jgi:hypothetical protein
VGHTARRARERCHRGGGATRSVTAGQLRRPRGVAVVPGDRLSRAVSGDGDQVHGVEMQRGVAEQYPPKRTSHRFRRVRSSRQPSAPPTAPCRPRWLEPGRGVEVNLVVKAVRQLWVGVEARRASGGG